MIDVRIGWPISFKTNDRGELLEEFGDQAMPRATKLRIKRLNGPNDRPPTIDKQAHEISAEMAGAKPLHSGKERQNGRNDRKIALAQIV